MKWSNEKIFNAIFGMALVSFFIYITIQHFVTQNKFNNSNIEKRYTIGEVKEYIPGAKTPPRYRYEFVVKGKNHIATHSITEKLKSNLPSELRKNIGKRYYVYYVVDQEIKYGKLLLYNPVKDSLLKTPPEGWKELPE